MGKTATSPAGGREGECRPWLCQRGFSSSPLSQAAPAAGWGGKKESEPFYFLFLNRKAAASPRQGGRTPAHTRAGRTPRSAPPPSGGPGPGPKPPPSRHPGPGAVRKALPPLPRPHGGTSPPRPLPPTPHPAGSPSSPRATGDRRRRPPRRPSAARAWGGRRGRPAHLPAAE